MNVAVLIRDCAAVHASENPAGTEVFQVHTNYMGIRQGRPGDGKQARRGHLNAPALPSGPARIEIPIYTSAEAQVKETLHQFESASSQGEGNG
jgi:hypothetical protein